MTISEKLQGIEERRINGGLEYRGIEKSKGCCTTQPQRLLWNVGSKPLCNYPWVCLLWALIGLQRVETLILANSKLPT